MTAEGFVLFSYLRALEILFKKSYHTPKSSFSAACTAAASKKKEKKKWVEVSRENESKSKFVIFCGLQNVNKAVPL